MSSKRQRYTADLGEGDDVVSNPQGDASPQPHPTRSIKNLFTPNTRAERTLLASDVPAAPAMVAAAAPASVSDWQRYAKPGVTLEVPLSAVDVNNRGARVFYATSEVDEVGGDIAASTQLVPARGYIREGRVILIDGQKRWLGKRSRGLEAIRVEFVEPPADPLDAYLQSRSANVKRSTHTALDDAVRWKEMLDANEFVDQNHIATKVGLNKTTVSQILSINDIPREYLERMKDHPGARSTRGAYAISRLWRDLDVAEAEEKTRAILSKAAMEDLSGEQIIKAVDQILSGRKKARLSPAEKHSFDIKGTSGQLKVYSERGEVALHVSGLDPAVAMGLQEALRQTIETFTASLPK